MTDTDAERAARRTALAEAMAAAVVRVCEYEDESTVPACDWRQP